MPQTQQPQVAPAPAPRQPHHYELLPPPPKIDGTPPGLEYLTQVDQILIKQEYTAWEVLTNWESKNRYRILNSMGQQIYYMIESSDDLERQCLGSCRQFEMHLFDNSQNEVMTIKRPRDIKCSNCCGMDEQQVFVEAPTGNKIATIKDNFACYPYVTVTDQYDRQVFRLQAPCCCCICPGWCDVKFNVMSADTGEEVGVVQKQWAGLFQEIFTSADNFGIQFPIDLDVKMKAALIGATILIDFSYFEEDNDNN